MICLTCNSPSHTNVTVEHFRRRLGNLRMENSISYGTTSHWRNALYRSHLLLLIFGYVAGSPIRMPVYGYDELCHWQNSYWKQWRHFSKSCWASVPPSTSTVPAFPFSFGPFAFWPFLWSCSLLSWMIFRISPFIPAHLSLDLSR